MTTLSRLFVAGALAFSIHAAFAADTEPANPVNDKLPPARAQIAAKQWRNAYSGELYLMMDDLPKAEERLSRLDKICRLPCDEYTELKKAVAAYKANGNKYVAQQSQW